MKARLIEPGKSVEQIREIPLTGEEFLIGRGADCNLRLRGTDISRHHCLIHLGKDEANVTDLGSSNGTLVNGMRIRAPKALKSGDELKVGEFVFIVDLGDNPDLLKQLEAAGDPSGATRRIRVSSKEESEKKDKA